MRRTIIDKRNLFKPRGIVVHPLEGYLFWTDWSHTKPSISRSNLDGSDIKVLFSKPEIVWPNGITIDYIAERIYWVDASKDYIASSNLHGNAFKKILEQDNRVAHPFAVGVYKDLMYWDDWKMNSVFSADKDHGIMIRSLADNMHSLMDLKVFAHSIQTGENSCSKSHNCSHICVGAPQNSHTCLCPDDMEITANGVCLCPGSHQPYANRTCPQIGNTCPPGFFTCSNKLCIPLLYRCDDDNDCGDGSDEESCPATKHPCPPHMFACASDGKCIPEYFKCDHDVDCPDGSDEHLCIFTDCKKNEFKCGNGRCINKKWLCDGEDDCRDGSDESSCTHPNVTATTCRADEFRCKGNGHCISASWRCDNDPDCNDSSDEENCDQKECDPWMFNCGDGRCIFRTWACDGDRDCISGIDEENCTIPQLPPMKEPIPSVCHDWMFKCGNGRCVPLWWKCDNINDCGDGTDEFGCPTRGIIASSTVGPTLGYDKIDTQRECLKNQFMCDGGTCIAKSYVCDGYPDCLSGEDEVNCPNAKPCDQGKFR